MINEKLAFACNVCKKVVEVNLRNKKGFDITAYENIMEWSDFRNNVPDLNTHIWARTIETPVKGEIKKVQVHFPFNMEVGNHFWTLFLPALSHFNGWDEYPAEINSSAIIKCCFKDIISKNEERAWIDIEVKEVLLLPDICNEFFPEDDIGYLDSLKSFGNTRMDEYGEWILFSDDVQGDIGVWGLIKKHGNYGNSLVLYGESDFHSDIVYCGNIYISEKELNDLIEFASTRK